MTKVVLASASPRRHELLRQIGVDFEVRAPYIDESPLAGESPVDYVRRVAVAKGSAVDRAVDELVIAADTTVDLDSEILAKPLDAAEAASMLRSLSGRSHLVHTGVAVFSGSLQLVEVCTTSVAFVPLAVALMPTCTSTAPYTF